MEAAGHCSSEPARLAAWVLLAALTCTLVPDRSARAYLTDNRTYFPPEYNSFIPPPAGTAYSDPVFGTPIKRLSFAPTIPDSAAIPNSAASGRLAFVIDEYSTMSPFSDDNSQILIQHQSYFALYSADGSHQKDCPLEMSASSEPRWSRSRPGVIYYLKGNQLKQYSTATSAVSVLHTFAEYKSVSGKGESDICFDGDHLVLAGDNRYIFLYSLSSVSKESVLDAGGRLFSSLYVTPDDNVLVTWAQSGKSRFSGVELFDRSMAFQRQLRETSGHMDVARDPSGDEVLLIANSSGGTSACGSNSIVKLRLADATETCVLSLDSSLALHISAPDNSGWFFVSTYAPSDPAAIGPGWGVYTNEILQVKLDGSQVFRLAHHRSRPLNDYNYQPRVASSRDGSRLVWSSNYGLQSRIPLDRNYSDVYLSTLSPAASGREPGSNAPTLNLQTNKTTYLPTETVGSSFFRLENPATTPVPIELKVWLRQPATTLVPILNLGSDGSLSLPGEFQTDSGAWRLADASLSGSYELGARMLDPVTGRQLCEDLNPFWIQPASGGAPATFGVRPADPDSDPSLHLTLDKSVYADGQSVVFAELRLRNPRPIEALVEIKLWLTAPGRLPLPIVNLGADRSFRLPPNADYVMPGQVIFSVAPAHARGTYELNARVLDPVTGRKLNEDLNSFVVQ